MNRSSFQPLRTNRKLFGSGRRSSPKPAVPVVVKHSDPFATIGFVWIAAAASFGAPHSSAGTRSAAAIN